MKILYVQPFCPSSLLYGGELRSRRFVDYLTKKGSVDMFILMKGGSETDQEYLKTRFRMFQYAENIGISSQWEKLKLFLPWQLAQLYSRDAQKQFNALVERENYDLIFVNKLYPVPYVLRLPAKWHSRVVVDFDDILSDLYRSSYKDLIVSLRNSFFLKINEDLALKRFKRVFVCAKNALAKIDQRYVSKVGIVPNVFTATPEHFAPRSQDVNRLFFVGSLDYAPNMEGLEWFLKNVWPAAKEKYAPLTLTVVGKAPYKPELIKAYLEKYKDVHVGLNVPDVKPYYRDCFASIVPLLNGSGTRLKILESYAYGRPVITTPKGMEGLDFEDNKNIYLFNNAAEFSRAYDALNERSQYDKVCRSGVEVLKEKYTPEAFVRSMDENWQFIK